MTIPCLSQNELVDYIKANGWEIISTDYWEEYNRLIFGKGNKSITFQCQDKYFYIAVIKTCKIFEIPAPPEHSHAYYRHMKMDNEPCYCGKELAFKDCHGKQ